MSSPDNLPAANDAGVVPPDRVALVAALVTAILSFTPVADWGSYYIIGACLFWAAFVVVWARRDRAIVRRWGFRADNLREAALLSAGVFLVGAAGLAAFAWVRGTLRFPLHALPLFLVYSTWGLIQQLLMLGVLANNLERSEVFRRHRALLVLFVALVFGLIHAIDWRLVLATFLLELVLVPLYLRHRNLWPLGLLHGWLGGLFYLWVLNRDLWAERFG